MKNEYVKREMLHKFIKGYFHMSLRSLDLKKVKGQTDEKLNFHG